MVVTANTNTKTFDEEGHQLEPKVPAGMTLTIENIGMCWKVGNANHALFQVSYTDPETGNKVTVWVDICDLDIM